MAAAKCRRKQRQSDFDENDEGRAPEMRADSSSQDPSVEEPTIMKSRAHTAQPEIDETSQRLNVQGPSSRCQPGVDGAARANVNQAGWAAVTASSQRERTPGITSGSNTATGCAAKGISVRSISQANTMAGPTAAAVAPPGR